MRLIQRNRRIHEEKSEVLAKLDTGAIAMPIAKTAARSRLLEIAADREAQRKQAEAAETKSELDQFDARLAKMPVDEQAGYLQISCSLLSTISVLFHFMVIASFASVCRDVEGYILRSLAGDSAALELDGPVGDPSLLQLHPEANEQHIMRVRRTLEEEAAAREEREKRRRKVRLHTLYFTVPVHVEALLANVQVCARLLLRLLRAGDHRADARTARAGGRVEGGAADAPPAAPVAGRAPNGRAAAASPPREAHNPREPRVPRGAVRRAPREGLRARARPRVCMPTCTTVHTNGVHFVSFALLALFQPSLSVAVGPSLSSN